MRRREFILSAVGLLGCATAAAQGVAVRKVGILWPLAESDQENRRREVAFKQSLLELGWVEGQNITFDTRYANAIPERLSPLAAELVDAKVDVIVTHAAQPIEAAIKATKTIPIVMATVGDAVGAGYVQSLSRPGGNVTGQTMVATEQAAKRLELIKEFLPGISRVALLWNLNAAGHRLQLKEMEVASPALGVAIQSLPVQGASEIDRALTMVRENCAEVIVTMDDPLIQGNRVRIIEFAQERRLPVMAEFRPFVAGGALMSYGGNQVEMWRRAATYVDRILKGENPADLPVAQPTKFDMVINLKTAKALGITVPATLLARADEVIE